MVTAIRKTSAWPLAAQLACTLVATVGVFLIQFPLNSKGFGHPFALFLSCVFMVALMFGRLSGFFAVALSALLSTAFFAPVSSIHLMRAFEYFQIEIYVALAVGATIMADQIHRVLISLSDINIQLASEDSRKTLQLREVAHRVANNFACLDALIRQRAMASKDPKIKFAFGQASELVHVVARLNNRLNVAVRRQRARQRSSLCRSCAKICKHVRAPASPYSAVPKVTTSRSLLQCRWDLSSTSS